MNCALLCKILVCKYTSKLPDDASVFAEETTSINYMRAACVSSDRWGNI